MIKIFALSVQNTNTTFSVGKSVGVFCLFPFVQSTNNNYSNSFIYISKLVWKNYRESKPNTENYNARKRSEPVTAWLLMQTKWQRVTDEKHYRIRANERCRQPC